MSRVKCDMDCFFCKLPDCRNSGYPTEKEMEMLHCGLGSVKPRPNRRKQKDKKNERPPEKLAIYKQRKKDLGKWREEQGLCNRCGKKLPNRDYKRCFDCRLKLAKRKMEAKQNNEKKR